MRADAPRAKVRNLRVDGSGIAPVWTPRVMTSIGLWALAEGFVVATSEPMLATGSRRGWFDVGSAEPAC
ncbi:hypothetical protein JOD64_003821 [Micromonospora luteifusca]|uniref:Uncharacterized protein n=1 Tax=Micromonospora luteifusca TaxID=709860 RepID=A0ABS2LWN5_9ACTN|nr:hypothetical protein [Micromonospora luteifusca]